MKLRLKKILYSPKPWGVFAVFILSNTLLSYGSFSAGAKGIIFVIGILLPFYQACRIFPQILGTRPPFFAKEFLPQIPYWSWWALGLVVVLTRLYKLESLIPRGDEGVAALYAIGLSEKWNWNFFYTVSQHTPLLFWVSSIFFRFIKSSPLDVWIFPALISITCFPLSYFVLRTIFSKSFCFLGGSLMVFSLWSFNCGRCLSQGVLILPWELICLFLLGAFLKEPNSSRKKKMVVFLGFTTGLGYLTFPSWPFVVLVVLLGVFGAFFFKPNSKNRQYVTYFIGFLLMAFLFYLWVAWKQDFGFSIRVLSALDKSISLQDRMMVSISYFSSLLWGAFGGVSIYDTDNLERLNPLWGAAFYLGLIQLIRYRTRKEILWAGFAFLLCLLPAVLSTYVEMFRVIQVLPFLLLIIAFGLGGLLIEIPRNSRFLALLFFLLVGAAFDGYRFSRLPGNPLTTSPESFKAGVSLEIPRAYRILKETYDQMGAGLIFTEFMPQWNDPTLFVTTYFLNAAENPHLNPGNARWASILTNEHYYPFLLSRFPGAKWYFLSRDLSRGKEIMLGLVPIQPENQQIFKQWIQAHHSFRQSTWDLNNISGPGSYATASQTLSEIRAFINNDRFLEACYWERMGEFYYQRGYQVHYQDLVQALKQAIEKGYPAAHLNYKLGSLYLRKKNYNEAQKAFEVALNLEPHYADVINAMGLLQTEKKLVGTAK